MLFTGPAVESAGAAEDAHSSASLRLSKDQKSHLLFV